MGGKTLVSNPFKFQIPKANKNCSKFFYFLWSIKECNQLPEHTVRSSSSSFCKNKLANSHF